MSLAQLKDEATQLTVEQRRELVAFLIALDTEQDEAFKQKLAAKIRDRDPSKWMDLDDEWDGDATYPPFPL